MKRPLDSQPVSTPREVTGGGFRPDPGQPPINGVEVSRRRTRAQRAEDRKLILDSGIIICFAAPPDRVEEIHAAKIREHMQRQGRRG